MDNVSLNLMETEDNFITQSLSCEMYFYLTQLQNRAYDGICFPKADLKFNEDGLTKLSTGSQFQNFLGIRQSDIQVLDFLGKGNQGYVHRAFYKPAQRAIAIKTVNILDRSNRHQLLNDIKVFLTSSQQQFTHLIEFYGAYYDHEEGTIKLILELMDVGNIRTILQVYNQIHPGQGISEAICRIIAHEILLGLKWLHQSMHQVHRDIKPENVLINSSGEVKLADFGISKSLEQTTALCRTFVGTLVYMSPERMESKYLGLMVVEMATGKYPYTLTNNCLANCQKIIQSEAPRLPNTKQFSLEFQDFVQLALQKEQKKRATVKDLLDHPWITKNKINKLELKEWIEQLQKDKKVLDAAELKESQVNNKMNIE